jgi:hypothetical protein
MDGHRSRQKIYLLVLILTGLLCGCQQAVPPLAQVSGPCYALNQGPPAQWEAPADLGCRR